MKRVVVALMMVLAACGGTAEPAEPVGEPMLPDLMARPAKDFHTRIDEETGARQVWFTSTIVNVGTGDFVLAGERGGGLFADPEEETWAVTQQVAYSEEGAESIPVDAVLVYGGDGHLHWHVRRVARYWLDPLDADLEPTGEVAGRSDTKVGFCFFDSDEHDTGLPGAPAEGVYTSDGCADEDARVMTMGLSVGWADEYDWYLEGQMIDLSGLEDGFYRIWGEADPEGWFTEASKDNNRSWIDIELYTRESDGAPIVQVFREQPE